MNVVCLKRHVMFAAGDIYQQDLPCLAERFPIEVRARASGFCHHHVALFCDLPEPMVARPAADRHSGSAIPMTVRGSIGLLIALAFGPAGRSQERSCELAIAG